MRVYLDNCCYNRPFDDQTQIKIALESQAKIYIQQLIVEKEVELVVSYISRFENSENPHIMSKNSIEKFFSNAVCYVGYEAEHNVEVKAREIMKTGVREKDALHIACAIEGRCDYFITTDRRILRFQPHEIKTCGPVDFINELEAIRDA